MNANVDQGILKRNSFHQTLLELRYDSSHGLRPDIFSQACVEQFHSRPKQTYGYLFAQVFEPYVLKEVSQIEGVEYEEVESLAYGGGEPLTIIKDLLANRSELSPVEAINLAAALISISRFSLSKAVLDGIAGRCSADRDRFEATMLHFVIANRLADKAGMSKRLAELRQLIQRGNLPPDRAIGAASQAIVWHMKSNVLSDESYQWFLNLGQNLSRPSAGVESGSLSSWYRAVAMVPAAKGDKESTREFMLAARKAAEIAIVTRPRAYETHFIKTYHESSLKEHMYVTRDRNSAIREGEALVALDPVWAPSYGELAEVYRFFGENRQAAELFERAGRLGPPYVGHHLFSAAQSYEADGASNEALVLYQELLAFAPKNASVVVAGFKLAQLLGDDVIVLFGDALEKMRPQLSKDHLAYLGG